MSERKRWMVVVLCGLLIAAALHSILRRHQEIVPLPQPQDPAPVSWFAPRQRPVPEDNIARELNTVLADAVEKVMPSVVVIRTEKVQYKIRRDTFGFYYRIPEQLMGEGSGIIIDERGYVMTSWHVIDGSGENSIEVVMNDGTKMKAREVGHDKATDLAVLKIMDESMTYPAVEFGDSDALRVGEMVIAIGSPFSLQSSVTVGHVSQKGRRMQVLPYEDFIQTDVAINEGNSGGPLIDVDGRLVGINAAILTAAQEKGIGIAFAVPSNLSMAIATSLIEDGKHEWPWIGASFGMVGKPGARQLQVTRIWRDTPAARQGLQLGDRVLEVNGKPMANEYDVYRVIFNHAVGKTVQFLVERDEKKQPEIELLLEEFPGTTF